jgi:drug/metabolite transporter (DMT)-like permease
MFPLPEGWGLQFELNFFPQLVIFALVLGSLTLLGYLFNNIGISLIGAAPASIFGATGPVLTSLLAWIIVGRNLTLMQFLGMLIVTAGVVGLSLEKIYTKRKVVPVSK